MRRLASTAAVALALALNAQAHNGVQHATPEEAAAHAAAPSPALPFPVDIEARFDLVDGRGERVTQASFAGRPMVVFFGYASCESICDVALPRLVDALAVLGDAGEPIVPIMITVDPERDSVESIDASLARWSRRLVGLTGSEQALADARAAFQVESKHLFDAPDGGAIFAHGSFIYVIGADRKVRTVMPPILSAERMAELMRAYLLG